MKNALGGFFAGALAIALIAGVWYLMEQGTLRAENPNSGARPEAPSADTTHEPILAPGASIGDENLVEFRCDDGRSMSAVFARDILGLSLSDGRQLELRQADAGDAIRYINLGETIEFQGKGEGAQLVEGGVTTYANCVAMI